MEFTASNGVRITTTNGGATLYSPGYSWPRGEVHTVFANADVVVALREFFLAERDAELGRWRWPENPDYVVYSKGDGWLVLSERSANSKHFSHREHAQVGWSDLAKAMRAYFDAHPVRKPWEDAKEGEVWVITLSMSLTMGDEPSECPAIFQAGRFRDHGGSWDARDISAARRIWPEGD